MATPLQPFFDACEAARQEAAGRWREADRFVFLYCDPEGAWQTAIEHEHIPNYLSAETEGVLMIYADGRVGICSAAPYRAAGD